MNLTRRNIERKNWNFVEVIYQILISGLLPSYFKNEECKSSSSNSEFKDLLHIYIPN